MMGFLPTQNPAMRRWFDGLLEGIAANRPQILAPLGSNPLPEQGPASCRCSPTASVSAARNSVDKTADGGRANCSGGFLSLPRAVHESTRHGARLAGFFRANRRVDRAAAGGDARSGCFSKKTFWFYSKLG